MSEKSNDNRFWKLMPTVLIYVYILCALTAGAMPLNATAKDGSDAADPFEMTFEELMKVKITTAGKMLEEIGNIPASVVIITRKDIERYGYMTLQEILQNIPGLYGIGEGNNIFFGVRGFYTENGNMIIMVDGVTQISAVTSAFRMNNLPIPVEAIDRIEVVRGPMSIMYGAGAFFGVINIITNQASTEEKQSLITASIGSQKTKKAFARFSGQQGDFNYVFNAALYDTYGMDVPYSKMMSNTSGLVNYGLSEDATTGGSLESNTKYFNFSGTFKDFYLNFQYCDVKAERFAFLPAFPPGHLWNPIHSRISFGYRKTLSDLYSFDGKITFFRNRIWMDFNWFSEYSFANQQTDSNTFEIEFNHYFDVSSQLNITAGLYYKTIKDGYIMVDWPALGSASLQNSMFKTENSIDNGALYTQVNYKPSKKLNFVAGIRLDKSNSYRLSGVSSFGMPGFTVNKGSYDRSKVEIIPRFAAIYKINKKNIIKLLYGKAVKRPSLFQVIQNTVLAPEIYELEPEYINTLELNVISYLSSTFTLNSSVFRNTLYNLITREVELSQDGSFQSLEKNAGKLVTTGVEFTFQFKPLNHCYLELSGIYQETKDKRPGMEDIRVAHSPKFLGYVKASVNVSNNFSLAVTGRYIDEIEPYYDTTVQNSDGSFGNRIGKKVPGYCVLDANVRIEKLFGTDLFINLRASNLFDSEIRYPVLTQNTWADKGTIDIGRSILLTVGLKF